MSLEKKTRRKKFPPTHPKFADADWLSPTARRQHGVSHAPIPRTAMLPPIPRTGQLPSGCQYVVVDSSKSLMCASMP